MKPPSMASRSSSRSRLARKAPGPTGSACPAISSRADSRLGRTQLASTSRQRNGSSASPASVPAPDPAGEQ